MLRHLRPFRFLAFATVLFGLSACQKTVPAPPTPPPAKVSVAFPVAKKLSDYIEATGYLDAKERVEIRPQVKGRLKKIHFEEGKEIGKGVLLYEIDDTEYVNAHEEALRAVERAKADVQRAMADNEQAKASLKRIESLKDSGISQDEYDLAVAKAKTSSAAVDQAEAAKNELETKAKQAKVELDYTKIFSPIEGRISRTYVSEGNLIGYMDNTLLTIMVNSNPIYVYFEIAERYAIEYERMARAENRPLWSAGKIPVEIAIETETSFDHSGVINFRDPKFEPGTGTVRLRGELTNENGILSSGMFARVRFPKGPKQDQLLIPYAALQADQRGSYILTVDTQNVVVPKLVQTGVRVGTWIAITGVTAEDRIIINGLQKARPKSTVDPELVTLPTPELP